MDGSGFAYLTELNLKSLDLNQSGVTAESLSHVAKIKSLRHLTTPQIEFGDAGLEQIGKMAGLQSLSMDNTQITDDGLAHIKGLKNLRYLHFAEAAITDDGLRHLEALSGLQRLSIRETFVTPEGVKHLQDKLPNLDVQARMGPRINSEYLATVKRLSRLGCRVTRRELSASDNAKQYVTNVVISSEWNGNASGLTEIRALGHIRQLSITHGVSRGHEWCHFRGLVGGGC